MTPHPHRKLEISSCIQCPFSMIDTAIVTTQNNEFCNFTVPYWTKKLSSHDTIPDWCPLPVHSSQQSERERVVDEAIETLNTSCDFNSPYKCQERLEELRQEGKEEK